MGNKTANKFGNGDKLIQSRNCEDRRLRIEAVNFYAGGVLKMATLGGWNIDEMKSVNLPQKAASAFTAVTGGLVGAEYMPVLYVGSQLVKGTNYCIIALQTLVTVDAPKRLVKMVIHEDLDGTASLNSIRGLSL